MHYFEKLIFLLLMTQNFILTVLILVCSVTADGITTNDIALIKLNNRANVREKFVKTLCLPTSQVLPTDDCYVTGFGIRCKFV